MSSRRRYLTQSELADFADITITDQTEADDRISQAEELIDAYVGTQDSFLESCERYFGVATSVSGRTITDSSGDTPLNQDDGYFTGCELEIIGGTGAGQRGIIASSSRSGQSVTMASSFGTAPDATSAYRIYQLGKFPRRKDAWHNSDTATPTWYKSVPEAVKRATAAQVQFMIQMGDGYFSSDKADMVSETISEYSYTKKPGNAVSQLIAPKAKSLLRGIAFRGGSIVY